MAAQIALVTGASRGIGRGIAVELARSGYSVAINYAGRKDAALECQKICGQTVPPNAQSSFDIFQADISQAPDRARLLDSVKKRFGRIDILVNNAGVAPSARNDLLETTEESFDRLMSINVRGPFFLTQAVAKSWIDGLKGAEAAGVKKPKIVN